MLDQRISSEKARNDLDWRPLAALDATLVFALPLGVDAAMIAMGARDPEWFWVYPIVGTLGSLVGAATTYRVGELAGKQGGAIAVKVAKENHDLRFDIPCLGPQTLETCAAARISVLAFEAGKSLLLEQQVCETLARKNKISIIAI